MRKNLVVILLSVIAVNLTAFNFRSESIWSDDKYAEYTYKTYESFEAFQQAIDPDDIDLPLMHAAVLYRTNKERAQRGLEPLSWKLNLETAAYHHSRVMREHGFFSHTSRVGGRRQPEDRARLAGIENPKIAENIATGFLIQYEPRRPVRFLGPGKFRYSNKKSGFIEYHTYLSLADALVQQWMNSPGHRANILSSKAYEIGIGISPFYKTSFNQMPSFYATQNFQWFRPVVAGESQDPLPPGWSR